MSAKTTTQPGRRTPLSLTGAASKGQPNKGGSNAASNNSNNPNGHTTANNNKQDNKLQQQKTEPQKSNNSDIKDNPNNKKVQQQQSDKKQQQQQPQNDNKKSVEKNQNGVNNSKQQQALEKKENQQQNKESKQQNGSNKLNEDDKKEKLEKQQDKSENLETKSKDLKKSEPEIQENNKKEEKKIKEVKDTKEENIVDKNEAAHELDDKNDENKSKIETNTEAANQKLEEEKIKAAEMTEEQQALQQISPPATPKSNRANKTLTAVNKTPTEKTPQKSTALNSTNKTTPITKREVTTTIDDVEMEPLTVKSSPIKSTQPQELANINIAPSATSTPGKIALPKRSTASKSDVQLAMQSGYSPERPRAFSQISGRKSIRPITDYTPSKFQSNTQFRESYRRINTELDVTNTSMNVTVGSEVPNNLSFSFFGRGRKRDRISPQPSQSAIGELHTDMEVSPPKKARFEGFLNAVSSPLTLLRSRFSKTTLQSSTPVKLEDKLNTAEDEIEVQNVSGVSIHEDLTKNEKETEMDTSSNKDVSLDEEAKSNSAIEEDLEKACGLGKNSEQSDIKITETPLQVAVGDPLAKNKRCIVM